MNAPVNIRQDGMMSVLSRVAAERQRYGMYNNNFYSPDVLYASDGLSQTIVDKPAEDAMSVGFSIDGDPNEDILNEFDRLEAIPVLTDCFRWTRLHGGAALLVFLDDGLPLTAPVNYNNINTVTDLIDYPASVITTVRAERYNDPTKKNYGWPSMYEIRPKFGLSFFVHESRLILIPGEPLPPSLIANQILPWIGRSALEACYTDLARYKEGLKISIEILKRKQQLIHKMSDLGNILAQGGDEIVAKRMAIADATRGNTTLLAIDALDEMILADTNLGGIDAVLKDYRIALCASSRLTQAILFGEQAGGLNANAEGEKSIYHSLLDGMRNRRLRPAIEKLAGFVWAQKSLGATQPARWRVVLEPLTVPTADELASVKLKEAQARKTDVEAVEVAMSGFFMVDTEARQALANIYPELNIDVTQLPEIPADPNMSDTSTGSFAG